MTRDTGVCDLMNSRMLSAAVMFFAVVLTCGGLSEVSAQSSGTWAIPQAQQAVREQINNQEGGRGQSVRFNNDVQMDERSNSAVRVSGTGTFSDNNRSSNNGGGRREFSYEALVDNRGRNRRGNSSVSEVRYDFRDGFDRNRGRGNNNNNNGNFGGGRGLPDGRVSYSGPIINRHSDKGLDVAGESMQEGANIQQWSFADQANQTWNVVDLGNGDVAILSQHSGMAITVQGGRDHNGANIIQRSWNNSRQQRWRLEQVGGEYYRIVSIDNGKVLDVTEAGREDGANIHLWDYVNKSNQQWRLRR